MTRRPLILLALGAATTLGAVWLTEPRGDIAPAPSVLAFPGLAARLPDAARIELRRGDTPLHLLRAGEHWVVAERHAYPARSGRVAELLAGLTELRLVEERAGEAARLGLDPEAAVALRVLDARGEALVEALLGRRRTRGQGTLGGGSLPETVILRRAGEAQAWLAEGSLPAEPDPDLWLDRAIADIPPERLRRVEVARQGEPPLALERDPTGQVLLRIAQPEGAAAADQAALDEVGRAFLALGFADVAQAAERRGEALGEARFDLDTGTVIQVRASTEEGRLWLRLAAQGDDTEAAGWNARWRGWTYEVSAWKEAAMLPRLADLLAR